MPALTPLEQDALREIGEMAAGAAGSAIAKMTGKRTQHVTSQLHEVSAREVAGALGVSGLGIAGAAVPLEGDLRGALLLAFPEPAARAVVGTLTGKPASSLGALEASALKELANVATGAYLAAFYRFLGLETVFKVPALATGGWEPLVKYTFLGNAPGAENVWAVASVVDTGVGEGRLFLLLDVKALERVLGAVHRRLHT